MPSGDRTGPEGTGSRTGRGLGYCNGYNSPGYTRGTPRGRGGFGRGYNRGLGRGFGRGLGRGRQRIYFPPIEERTSEIAPNEDEKFYLENVLRNLEEEIKQVKDRLQNLTNETKE